MNKAIQAAQKAARRAIESTYTGLTDAANEAADMIAEGVHA